MTFETEVPHLSLGIVNGVVFTASARRPWAQAVAVTRGRIAAVGATSEVRAALPADAEIIDAGGRAVLPGFIDAHNHFLATGESLATVDVRYPAVRSVADLVAAIGRAVAGRDPGERISAYGFDHAKYERAPTRWDLDGVAPRNPVLIGHVSGHGMLVNSAALREQGVGEDTPEPPGGRVYRDEAGRLTGLFTDAAMGVVQPAVVDIGHHGPNFHIAAPPAELVAAVERAGDAYLAAGLTTVCDAQVTRRELGAYLAARRQGRLRVRTVCMPLSHQLEAYEQLGLAGPFGDDWLSVGPMKFYCDGSLIAGTAAFAEPGGEFTGLLFWDEAAFAAAIARAHANGWQIGVHAQGDHAIGVALDAFERAQRAYPAADPRFRIEHAGFPRPDQLARIRDLRVILVCQPSHLRDSGDEFLRDHPGRANGLQPLRTALAEGIRVVLSSDSDVASYRPLDTIAAAMRRRTLAGAAIGPDQAIDVEAAVRAHTIEAAYAIRAEDRIGSLEVGKSADIVILEGNLFTAGPDEIAGLGVHTTVIGGEIAFTAARPEARPPAR